MMSQNLLESILQVDLDWKEQVHNYQSIAELQSCDLFFKFNSWLFSLILLVIHLIISQSESKPN